ncbi:MAG: class I SAM-dependent methyltransferase [Alphaproteobacteria bacterium]
MNRARFSEVLLTECKPERVWFVDPWFEEDIRAIALATLSRFPNAVVLQETSEAAVSRFDDESLDWIYIDGSHEYEDVRHDLRAWAPKIRSGGVIAGDDYYWRNAAGDYSVKKAVDEFLVDAPVSRWFMVAGQFVMTKA